MIKRVLFPALLFLVFISNVFALGEQEEHWISMLGSTNQQDRDVAAKKLLVVFHHSNKKEWATRLSWVQPGMGLKDVETKLEKVLGQKIKGMMADCGGGTCSQSYRLDGCYIFTIWCDDRQSDHKIISSEIVDQIEYKWVEPPPKFSGVWITYYVNGQKSHEINYKDGKYNGRFTSFRADSSKAVIQHYADNIAEGEDTGYFPSGRIMYRGVYKAGVQVGMWTWYNEDGTVQPTQDHTKPS
jgi:hypothetical protein